MNKFKDALQSLEDFGEPTTPEHDKAIRLALRIAQAVTDEPTDAVKQAGINANVGPRSSSHNYIFRAMIEQMMRELDKSL